MAGWDFYFLTVLLAGSEERVFFFPGTLNINQDWRGDTQLVLSVSYN